MARNKNWAKDYLSNNNNDNLALLTNKKDIERIEVQIDFNYYVDNGFIDLSFLAANEVEIMKSLLIKL